MTSMWGATESDNKYSRQGPDPFYQASRMVQPLVDPPVVSTVAAACGGGNGSTLFHYPQQVAQQQAQEKLQHKQQQPLLSDGQAWNTAARQASTVTMAKLRLAYELAEQQRHQEVAALQQARSVPLSVPPNALGGHFNDPAGPPVSQSAHSPRSSGSISPQPLQPHVAQQLATAANALAALQQNSKMGRPSPVAIQEARWLADHLSRYSTSPTAMSSLLPSLNTLSMQHQEDNWNRATYPQLAAARAHAQQQQQQGPHPFAGLHGNHGFGQLSPLDSATGTVAGFQENNLRAWQSAPPFNRAGHRSTSLPDRHAAQAVRAYLSQDGGQSQRQLDHWSNAAQYPAAWVAVAGLQQQQEMQPQSDAEAYCKLEKRIRAVRKRLRQIEEIKNKAYEGKIINMDQEQKLRKETGFRTELAHLELACALIQRSAQGQLNVQPTLSMPPATPSVPQPMFNSVGAGLGSGLHADLGNGIGTFPSQQSLPPTTYGSQSQRHMLHQQLYQQQQQHNSMPPAHQYGVNGLRDAQIGGYPRIPVTSPLCY